MGQKDTEEKTEDVSDPEFLESVEAAVRVNKSLKTITIDCIEVSWTNITIAILKGVIANTSLREMKLAIPVEPPDALREVVEKVRKEKPKLRLVVRAGPVEGKSEFLSHAALPLVVSPFIVAHVPYKYRIVT